MKLKLIFEAQDYKGRWPKIKVFNNDVLLDDFQCQLKVEKNYNINPLKENLLIIEHYGKKFGDNDIWDASSDGEIKAKLLDILFDDVSIDHLITSIKFETIWTENQLKYETQESIVNYSSYYSHGEMTFNGKLSFKYETPIYDFLILKKYKQDYNENLAYFSNYTESFNYDKGLEKISKIKELLQRYG